MADPHQIFTLIAAAIHDCQRQDPHKLTPDHAKQIAKCILAALEDAGLQVVPKKDDR